FVTDINNSRVHRFDRAADGSYAAKLVMGNTAVDDANRQGHCALPGKLAAPYDLALSPGGELFVMNTSCYYMGDVLGLPAGTVEVQRFAQDGTPRGYIRGRALAGHKVHGIAMDGRGVVHLTQG